MDGIQKFFKNAHRIGYPAHHGCPDGHGWQVLAFNFERQVVFDVGLELQV